MDAARPLDHDAALRRPWPPLWPAGYLLVASIAIFLALRQQGYGDPFITCHIGDRLRNVPRSIGHPSPAAISVAPFASWAG